jgi:CRP-like cAMP-binding protein
LGAYPGVRPIPALTAFVAKLERRAPLPPSAKEALLAVKTTQKEYVNHQEIFREGDDPPSCCLVERGIVSRYKTLRDGATQILAFYISGDLANLSSSMVSVADHGIRAQSDVLVHFIPHATIMELCAEHVAIGQAMGFDIMVDGAIAWEWVVNIGRRDSRARTAHLLLEMATRYKVLGKLQGGTFPFPISQVDLSDALGITPVHLNRTLRWLRRDGLLSINFPEMTIENWDELCEVAGFEPVYLHLEGPRQPAARAA